MAVNGSEAAEFDKLMKKSKSWAETVRTGFLHHNDVLSVLRTTIQKTLDYPMSVIHLTKVQWETVMSPILRVALPKSGVCRNFPRAVTFGPTKFQGMGVDHPYATQVESHVVACMRHGNSESLTGKFLQQDLESHQLELGLPVGVFQNHFDLTGGLASNTWIKRVWEELDGLDMHLAYKGPDVHLHRKKDAFLMQQFLDKGHKGESLKWLNWCRMFLHAVTLSDIVTADGSKILLSAWKGELDPSRSSPFNWPRLKRPPTAWWREWQEALQELLLDRRTESMHLCSDPRAAPGELPATLSTTPLAVSSVLAS